MLDIIPLKRRSHIIQAGHWQASRRSAAVTLTDYDSERVVLPVAHLVQEQKREIL
jgi:hypothetical protein